MTNEIQVHILAEYFLPQTKDFWRGGGHKIPNFPRHLSL